jgi:uncharacterized membrane protein YeaQ/YmgE (transglycosylase-associated protein family)
LLGAIILGLLAGWIARILTPGRTPRGLLTTLFLGLAGAAVGYLIFTELLGIGDTEVFDLGGLPGAVIGTMILLYLHRRLVVEPTRWPR